MKIITISNDTIEVQTSIGYTNNYRYRSIKTTKPKIIAILKRADELNLEVYDFTSGNNLLKAIVFP